MIKTNSGGGIVDSVINQWNNAAESYSEFEATSMYSRFCRELISNRFNYVRGLKILDAGCGHGIFTHILSQNGGDVTGCDGSDEMLKIARSSYPQYRFDEVDLKFGLPYEDAQFDCVLCSLVLMDIDPIDSIITEFHRVLEPNGTLFFSIVHPAFYPGVWEKNENGVAVSKKVSRYINHFSLSQNTWGETMHYHRPISYYYNMMSTAGFRLTEMLEPNVYEGAKIPDIPLYLFSEFKKTDCM